MTDTQTEPSGDGSDEIPRVHFDHHSPEVAADPWPILADLRGRCPVAKSDAHDGFWVVTGYEQIKQVATDDYTFSSDQAILIPDKANKSQRSLPIECDPPLFQEYRRVMHPMFAPGAVERLVPTMELYVHESIDTFIETGSCDIVHDFADPVPAKTTLHKLGLNVADWRRFSEPLHKTIYLRQDNPLREGVLEELAWIKETLASAIEDRRRLPRDDMLTYLLSGHVFDRPVTDEEAREMAMLTIQGGFDTTGSAISSALRYLDDNRDDRQRLIDHPEDIPKAVEELLRYEGPLFALGRRATTDVEVGGQQIAEGDRVLMVWDSGNRDESVFENPDEVDFDRFPNRHMTFGLGGHRCLGSTLARRTIQVAIDAILRRMPDYELDRENLVRAETVGTSYGTFAMPATFTPGPVVLGHPGRTDRPPGAL